MNECIVATDARALQLKTLANDDATMAVWDARAQVLGAVFWAAGALSLPDTFLRVEASAPVALIGRFAGNPRAWNVTVADPEQSATEVRVSLEWLPGVLPAAWGGIKLGELRIALPQGADAGKSVTVPVL